MFVRWWYMYACMYYVSICVCTYLCMSVHMYVCMQRCIGINFCTLYECMYLSMIHVCVYVCVFIYMYIWMWHMCVFLHGYHLCSMYLYMYLCKQVCLYGSIDVCVHAHMYVCMYVTALRCLASQTRAAIYIYLCIYTYEYKYRLHNSMYLCLHTYIDMGWLRLVGSIKS